MPLHRLASLCLIVTASAQELSGPGCRETIALTENLVKVVDVMRQRLDNRDCAEGFIEDHLGMCVNVTSQAATFGREFSATLEDLDTTHGLQSVATGALTFDNAGKLLSWTIWAGAPGTLSLQVWRPDDQNSENFQLICDNAVSALQSGLNVFDIPEAEQCMFLPGDSIGWSQRPSRSGVISYTTEDVTANDVVRYREGTTSPAVEQVYSFAESHSPNRIYAIAATVQYF